MKKICIFYFLRVILTQFVTLCSRKNSKIKHVSLQDATNFVILAYLCIVKRMVQVKISAYMNYNNFMNVVSF